MATVNARLNHHIRCAMFPNPFTDTEWMQSNHPILPEIAAGLGSLGCDCLPTPKYPSLLWLTANRRHIDVIHFHWPEQYYWPTMHSRLVRLLSLVAHRWGLQGTMRFLSLAWLFAFVSLARLFRLPIVWTIHDLYPHGQTPGEHYRAEHLARAYLMRNISVLILNCRSAESLVTAEFGAPTTTVVAPLGHYRKFYPDTVSADEARQALGVLEDQIVFLYIGTMRKHRNALPLIRAFRHLTQQNLRLFVVGETWEHLRGEMERAAWGDWRIRCFFQLASNDQLEFLLKTSDFVVMPGEYYLSSAVVMLALSYGRPVIAPRYGCTGEMVGGAGILYDHQNELGLAGALGMAIQADKHKYQRLAEARARSFSWSLTAARTMQAYSIAVGGVST